MKKILVAVLLAGILSSNAFAYYQAEQGRWLNRDPIGEKGGINRYAQVLNNTINSFDPLGLDNYNGNQNDVSNVEFPDPDAGTPRPGDFHHYGNWGGRGWANGGWNPETGDLPGPGDPGYNAPIDARDACYEAHDRCISGCPKCPEEALRECVAGTCDPQLSSCLSEVRQRLEAWLFRTIIPWGHRNGLVDI